METLRMTDYSSPDGTYNIPLIEREINNRFSFFETSLAGNIICKKGETTSKTFYISFHDIYNIQETSIEDIFIGIYEIGTKAPIWHKYHKFSNDTDPSLGVDFQRELSFQVDNLELSCGSYFVLLGNIQPNYENKLLNFAGCYRVNFSVLPNGYTLKENRPTHYSIKYISNKDKGKSSSTKYDSNNLLSFTDDFPIYQLSITLETAPNPSVDKYDLLIFDESLCCKNYINNVLTQQTEIISFIPPYGLPYGTTHLILYHNDKPYIHFQCRRNKRLGTLKAEYINPNSIYRHLLYHPTLQLYGCKKIKKNIISILNTHDSCFPKYLCITDKSGNGYNVVENIKEDFYKNNKSTYITSYKSVQENSFIKNNKDTLLIWHLSQTATSQWKKVINYIEKYLKVNNLNLIICGTEDMVEKLFDKYNYISQLIPKNNRWHTEPFSQMEMVYNMINNWHCEYDAAMPNYRTYEYFYKKVFTLE